jgi:hypothetical protein
MGDAITRNCVLTTVYPAALRWWPDFLDSIDAQGAAFSLVVVAEDVLREDLGAVDRPLHLVAGTTDQPAENRRIGIETIVRKGFERVVFADVDDQFSPTRMSRCLQALDTADLVVNDVVPFTNRIPDVPVGRFGPRIRDAVLDLDFVLHQNVFGLSNTACRVDCLRGLNVGAEVTAVDWFLFSLVLLRGARAAFVPDVYTFYRQHSDNIAGAERVDAATRQRIKAQHYAALLDYEHGVDIPPAVRTTLHDTLSGLEAHVKRSPGTPPLWWE